MRQHLCTVQKLRLNCPYFAELCNSQTCAISLRDYLTTSRINTKGRSVRGGGYFRVLGLPLTVFRVLICIGRLDSYLIAPWIRIRGPHSAPFLIITSLGADFYFIM